MVCRPVPPLLELFALFLRSSFRTRLQLKHDDRVQIDRDCGEGPSRCCRGWCLRGQTRPPTVQTLRRRGCSPHLIRIHDPTPLQRRSGAVAATRTQTTGSGGRWVPEPSHARTPTKESTGRPAVRRVWTLGEEGGGLGGRTARCVEESGCRAITHLRAAVGGALFLQ